MRHLIMGTAGHVDHGKTALIKALTNIDCDTHKEEKRRGITINLGFSYLTLPNGESIGIIDVPGHKDFINTMVSGASGIDFVLLVIAADSGIMPQTIEHVNIISALGIKNGIIALTKIDLVDDEIVELAKLEILEFLDNTPLKNSPIVGVSSLKREGIDELVMSIEEIIPKISERNKGEIFRLYIDRSFAVKGIGMVVTGTVLNGSITVGQEVFLLPGKSKYRAKSIERHGIVVNNVTAGDRAAIQLVGLKKEDVIKGSLISDKLLDFTKMVDARLFLFDTDFKLSNWSVVTFHTGTFECQARMHKLHVENDERNIIVQFHLEKSATLLTNDKFIIRNSSGDKTIGGGLLIDVFPLHHKKRTPKLLDSLSILSKSISDNNNVENILSIELKKELRPFSIEQLAEKINIKKEDILLQTECQSPKGYVQYNNVLIYKEYDNVFLEKVKLILTEFHKENSLSEKGLTLNEIIGKLNLNKISCGKEYLDSLLIKMKSDRLLEFENNTWKIKGFNLTIDCKTLEEINWLEKEFLNYDIQKPVLLDIDERAKVKGVSKDQIKKYLHYLIGKNKLFLFKTDIIHCDVVNKYKSALLAELEMNENGIEISEFRFKTGVSKRLAPILISIFESQKIIITKTEGIKVQIYLKK